MIPGTPDGGNKVICGYTGCTLITFTLIDNQLDGWMTCNFTSFLKVFQSYQDEVWMVMKGCEQWNSICIEKISP